MRVTSVDDVVLIECGRVALWATQGVVLCGVAGGRYFVTPHWSRHKDAVERVWGWDGFQVRKMIERGEMAVLRDDAITMKVRFDDES